MSSGDNFTAVSLFAGAGGLDMGFENSGIHVLWANDFNQDACNTHKLWSDATVVCGDIGKVDFDTIPSSDVILGGFPCQGFSLAGPRKIDDSRNILYRHFVKLVAVKQPKVFIAENVKGILTLGNGQIMEAIIADFSSMGYNVTYRVVNAADYKVPQDRIRVIITGIRKDIDREFVMPEPFKKRVTIKDVIGHFADPDPDDVCMAPYSSRFMSRNRRRGWDDVSYTIPAMAKQVALHPSSPMMEKLDKDLWKFGNGVTRRFSYKEAAAIQTFPEDMTFCGDLVSKYKQIGNAVPVKLAEVIASEVKHILEA